MRLLGGCILVLAGAATVRAQMMPSGMPRPGGFDLSPIIASLLLFGIFNAASTLG